MAKIEIGAKNSIWTFFLLYNSDENYIVEDSQLCIVSTNEITLKEATL